MIHVNSINSLLDMFVVSDHKRASYWSNARRFVKIVCTEQRDHLYQLFWMLISKWNSRYCLPGSHHWKILGNKRLVVMIVPLCIVYMRLLMMMVIIWVKRVSCLYWTNSGKIKLPRWCSSCRPFRGCTDCNRNWAVFCWINHSTVG